MKNVLIAILALSSFSIFAVDCKFHTTAFDGRVISQNLIYEAESKSVIDNRSGIKIDFKHDSNFKVTVSDLNGLKIYETTFNEPFDDAKIESVSLGKDMYLSGSCSSDLFNLVQKIDDKEWSRRADLESKCMGRSK